MTRSGVGNNSHLLPKLAFWGGGGVWGGGVWWGGGVREREGGKGGRGVYIAFKMKTPHKTHLVKLY